MFRVNLWINKTNERKMASCHFKRLLWNLDAWIFKLLGSLVHANQSFIIKGKFCWRVFFNPPKKLLQELPAQQWATVNHTLKECRINVHPHYTISCHYKPNTKSDQAASACSVSTHPKSDSNTLLKKANETTLSKTQHHIYPNDRDKSYLAGRAQRVQYDFYRWPDPAF